MKTTAEKIAAAALKAGARAHAASTGALAG